MDDNAAVRTGDGRISPLEFTRIERAPVVQPVISIVIATHNRGLDVTENVDALLPQCVGKPVEVFVVDSASSPTEARILEALKDRDGLTFIRLEEPGVARARNAGLFAGRGEWIALLDDDAVPRAGWVDAALAGVARCNSNTAILAGRVTPRWQVDDPQATLSPDNLGRRAKLLLSVVEETGFKDTTRHPVGVGANMLFRREALLKMGGFDVRTGRVGSNLASGEEALMMMHLTDAGHECWYDEAFVVDHKVHGNRLNRAWLAERARNEGEVEWLRLKNSGRRARRAVKMLVTLPILAVLQAFDNPDEEYYLRFNHNLGMIRRMFGLSKKG